MRKLPCITMLLLCLLLMGCAAAETVTVADTSLTFNENGMLTQLTQGDRSLTLEGIVTDVGIDGAFLYQTIGYQRFWDMATWDLATIVPMNKALPLQEVVSVTPDENGVTIVLLTDDVLLTQRYTVMASALKIDVTITSKRSTVCEIQGVNFQLRAADMPEGTTFEFPGNTPAGVFSLSSLRAFSTKQTEYCNPVVLLRTNDNSGINAFFLNEEEKWSTAVHQNKNGQLFINNLSMTELLIAPEESIYVGAMYLQLTGEDPYAPLQALYAENGYHAPADGAASGPVYSCHPAGTMDSGFRDTKTMRLYADESLQALADMGIENIWVLPIFEHLNRGVYHPTDQAILDKRYGTDEDVAYYVDMAHALGMKVLFDYVPHGPRPEDPLAVDNPQWCSVARNGQIQIEWDCVSFDMANTDYQAYTTALIEEHVTRFHIDGGRIDCAMGGLSNWAPQAGNRASSSSLKGGVGIVTAIRGGFLQSGVTPTLLPENFHPVPFYASVTDVFYDMPLYRMMYVLRQENADEMTFATTVMQWLRSENLTSVPGQMKLRFLGNHDTVSWTWDRARATFLYGEEKAKAMWALMSFIDGMPFLYQGDENSDLYHFKYGYNLEEFFTALFSARKAYLSDDMTTVYTLNDLGAAIFLRQNGTEKRLVLINLCAGELFIPAETLPAAYADILYGSAAVTADGVTLPEYGVVMFDCPTL